MESKDLVAIFEEQLQRFLASVVLIEPEDPGSYKDALFLLDELSALTYARENPQVNDFLKDTQRIIEACLLDSNLFPEYIKKLEEDLKQFRHQYVDMARNDFDERVEAVEDSTPEVSIDEEVDTVDPVDMDVTMDTPAPPEEEVEMPVLEETSDEDTPILFSDDDRELMEDFLLEASENLGSIEVRLVNLENDPENLEEVNNIFRPFHTIKGVSGFLNLHDIHRLTHNIEDLLDQARNGYIKMGEWEIEVVLGSVDLLGRLLDQVQQRLDGVEIKGLTKEVNTFLKNFMQGEVQKETISQEDTPDQADRGGDEEDDGILGESIESFNEAESLPLIETIPPEAAIGARPGIAGEGHTQSTIKVDMYKLDNLVDMVGELVIGQSLIQQNPNIKQIYDHRLNKDFSHLGRIISELRDTTMTLRMVPFRQTFQKMIRLVRDLSRKSGKAIKLEMSGEETEIDRSMVDAIYEPLVHMVRNGCDHGIEAKEVRRAAGKSEVGHLYLRAYHKGGNVIIEIQDDGKGLDKDKILEKAQARGWVSEGENLEDHEIYQLIFRPGFTTAEKITDVSGRGVGMDVVKRTLEKLRGKIEIQSKLGEGSTFIISLPITLAIIDGIVVSIGQERYIVPTMAIHEAFSPNKKECLTVAGKGEIIRFRERLYPLIRLHELFSIDDAKTNPWEALVIVVESEGETCCILVDEVLEKQEVVIKTLGNACPPARGVTGGSILGDGRVGLILDINGLFRLRELNPNFDKALTKDLMI